MNVTNIRTHKMEVCANLDRFTCILQAMVRLISCHFHFNRGLLFVLKLVILSLHERKRRKSVFSIRTWLSYARLLRTIIIFGIAKHDLRNKTSNNAIIIVTILQIIY